MTNREMMLLETTSNDQWVNKWAALQRLQKNPDFIDVIMEGFIHDRAINGVSMLSNDAVKNSGQRGDVMEMLVASSTLMDYFRVIKILGDIAQDDLDEEEAPEVSE